MKKIIALMIAALSLVAILTGCVREDMNISLNKDGTGSISVTMALKRGFYQQLKDMNDFDPFTDKETFTVEYDGEEYIAFKEVTEYASFEEMERELSEMSFGNEADFFEDDNAASEGDPEETSDIAAEPEVSAIPEATDEYDDVIPESNTGEALVKKVFKSVEIKKDRSKYSFHAVLNSVEGESFGYDISEVLKVTVTVEMPGKITAYKGGTVSDNVITFDISDLSEETELYVESKTGSALPAVIGTVVILGGIAAFIFLRKKR